MLVSKDSGGGSRTGYDVNLANGTGTLNFSVFVNGTNYFINPSQVVITDGHWHHIVSIRSGSTISM
jgi:hypothetical protein